MTLVKKGKADFIQDLPDGCRDCCLEGREIGLSSQYSREEWGLQPRRSGARWGEITRRHHGSGGSLATLTLPSS